MIRRNKIPIYTYKCIATGEEIDINMPIAEMEVFESTQSDQFIRQFKPLNIGDSVRLGITKSPASFNDLMKTIKGRNLHSTMNTGNGEV